jgi:hypothetical protein
LCPVLINLLPTHMSMCLLHCCSWQQSTGNKVNSHKCIKKIYSTTKSIQLFKWGKHRSYMLVC